MLHPLVLGAVCTTVEAAARLQAQLQQQQPGGGAAFPALQQLAAGIGDALPELRQAIEQCIQVRGGCCSARLLRHGPVCHFSHSPATATAC